MDQNNLQDNLSLLMTEESISAIQLARETNVPLSTIKKIRSGVNLNPTIATLLPLARYFKRTVEELMSSQLITPRILWQQRSINAAVPTDLPVISWDEVLLWPNISTMRRFTIFTELLFSEYAFVVRIDEDDWNFFSNGSLLLIEPQLYPSHRDYIVVHKKGMSSPTLKQILIEEDNSFLQSIKISEKFDRLTDEHHILGVVMEYRLPLKRKPLLKKATLELEQQFLEREKT